MIQINDEGFFNIFPSIKNITRAFEYQNAMLNKIVLTGKINALEIAENLFDFTEQTADTFASLQKRLIENLLEENKKAILIKAKLKAESIVTILIKALYEASKNIELLTKDEYIIDYLENKIPKIKIKKYLEKYRDIYKSYNDLLILSTDKKVRININPKNKILKTDDSIVEEAIKTHNYIQVYKKSDLIIFQKKSLLFAKRVVNNKNEVIGVVVLSFDLKNEMKNIFDKILEKNEVFSIIDNFNNLVISSEIGIDDKFLKSINKIDKPIILNNKFNLKTKVKSYKEYSVGNWYAVISLKSQDNVNILLESDKTSSNIKHLICINIRNRELKKLTEEAYSILEDLSDVIINGELIAAKSKQYILIPILDNLREVSFKVVKLIEISISSLQKVIDDSFSNSVKNISKFIMFSVVKYIYETVNDLNWWSYNNVFIKELSSDAPDVSRLKNELLRIDNIYLNYYNIFIFDSRGRVIASSKVGEGFEIEDKIILSRIDDYYISEFKPSIFYNNQETFVVYKSITQENNIIGGIGIVFEMNELNDVLNSILDLEGSFALLVDKEKKVIASTISDDTSIINKINSLELKDSLIQDIEINNKNYKIAVSHFEKYKNIENNPLYAVVAIEK